MIGDIINHTNFLYLQFYSTSHISSRMHVRTRTRQQEKIRLSNITATLGKTYLIDVQNVVMGDLGATAVATAIMVRRYNHNK